MEPPPLAHSVSALFFCIVSELIANLQLRFGTTLASWNRRPQFASNPAFNLELLLQDAVAQETAGEYDDKGHHETQFPKTIPTLCGIFHPYATPMPHITMLISET